MIIVICLNPAQADRFGRLIHYCTSSGIRNDYHTLLGSLACDCRNTVKWLPDNGVSVTRHVTVLEYQRLK